jgi:hypothetical protein
MRGRERQTAMLLSYVSPEALVPKITRCGRSRCCWIRRLTVLG